MHLVIEFHKMNTDKAALAHLGILSLTVSVRDLHVICSCVRARRALLRFEVFEVFESKKTVALSLRIAKEGKNVSHCGRLSQTLIKKEERSDQTLRIA